jgi:flavin reductase (DIM6/NTAB) family NADH-FMN oxidoreductase RutF
MERSWQDVLDRFHYGIYLVTVASDGMYNGMIASWVTQCSHEPPLVALAVRNSRLSREQITRSGAFTLNLLPVNARPMVGRFKIPDWRRKFDGVDYELSPHGAPVLKDAVGYLDFSVERMVETGDHVLFVARVVSGGIVKDGEALSTREYPGRYRGDR